MLGILIGLVLGINSRDDLIELSPVRPDVAGMQAVLYLDDVQVTHAQNGPVLRAIYSARVDQADHFLAVNLNAAVSEVEVLFLVTVGTPRASRRRVARRWQR